MKAGERLIPNPAINFRFYTKIRCLFPRFILGAIWLNQCRFGRNNSNCN